MLSWEDGRPAVGQCRDKAWECCAGITVLPSTTKDTFGSLLHKVGNSRLDAVDSLELQAETVEKITISGAAASTVHVVPLNAPVLTVSSVSVP